MPGTSSWPSSRKRSDRRGRRAPSPGRRGRAARSARALQKNDGQIAARPVQVRLDDLEREAGRDRGVERVAAALEHGHAGRRREPVGRRDHPEGAAQLRAGGEGHRLAPLRPARPATPARRGASAAAADEVAGDEMATAGDVHERRLLLGRARRRLPLERAARPEAAARRRRDRARDVTLQHDPRPRPLNVRVRHDRRRQQRLRVGVLGSREQLVARRELDDLAEVHHRDPIAEELDRGEVVADEEAREAELVLQIPEQVEHGRLDGDVERRDRLVRDQQARARR